MDIIVVYDAGIESAADFERTRAYLSGGFLKEFLRTGDTFHLISFTETPRIELSRRVEGPGDYRTIIGRLFLLYPLARSSSLENALRYTEQFVADLPPARLKKVVFFSAKPELAAMTAAEVSAGFNEQTEVFFAPIPASFDTLRSGRALARSAAVSAAPPVAAPAATASAATTPPAPGVPVAAASNAVSAPREPAAARTPSAPSLPPPAPRAAGNPVEPADAVPTFTPPVRDAVQVAFEDTAPVFLDKRNVMLIILPVAALLILGTVTFAYILSWKKRAAADTHTQHDFLYRQAAEERRTHEASSGGLLQKSANVAAASIAEAPRTPTPVPAPAIELA